MTTKGDAMFAICFDFPEAEGEPLFAGMAGNPPAFGFAPTLASAKMYDDRATAERVLANAYGPTVASFGTVVEVPAS